MQRLKEQSLALQLPLIAAGCAFLVSLCLLWLAATSSAYLHKQSEERHGEALARQIAASLRDPLQRGDLLSARVTLQRFIDNSLATGVSITDVEGMPMGSAGEPDGSAQNRYRAPISIGEDIAGEVVVSVDNRAQRESQWRFLFSLLALSAALSLVVFMATRALARRLSQRLLALRSQLLLPDSGETASANELLHLEATVRELPLDMLRGHAPVPAASSEFLRGTVLFVHLASLARYVDTLSESNLHRYSRRLQQILQAAAQCYRAEVSVTRPFGASIRFLPQPNAGSEALRAAACARLIALIAEGLKSRTTLSIDMAIALGLCEQSPDDADDMYPQLHLQGVIDELRESCLRQERFPVVLVDAGVLDDTQLAAVAETAGLVDGLRQLQSLAPEQETLLAHQARMIVERIKPSAG